MNIIRRRRLALLTKLLLLAVIVLMVKWLNQKYWDTSRYVAIKEFQCEAIRHKAGMFQINGDGRFYWWDELEQMADPTMKNQFLQQNGGPGPGIPPGMYLFKVHPKAPAAPKAPTKHKSGVWM